MVLLLTDGGISHFCAGPAGGVALVQFRWLAPAALKLELKESRLRFPFLELVYSRRLDLVNHDGQVLPNWQEIFPVGQQVTVVIQDFLVTVRVTQITLGN